RIGRKETVFAKRYIMRDTIEEKMLKLKEKKQGIAESLIDDQNLTDDDLLFLLDGTIF
ncbi:unnamed protein product, partial [marine sediment metagenome]